MSTDGYYENMFKTFQNYRKKNILCDVSIFIDCKPFPVHKVILSAASNYFKILFTAEMKESGLDNIPIKGVTELAFKKCLDFIYHEGIDITLNDVGDLLHAACLFQLDKLKERCVGLIQSNLDVDNCIQLYQFSRVYDCANIELHSRDIILQNADKFLKDEKVISELDFDTFRMMVISEDLTVSDESVVFEALMKWIAVDEERRKGHFCEIMGFIRLPVLKMNYFTTVVCKNSHMQYDCQKCKQYLAKCKTYFIGGKKHGLTESKLRKRAPEVLVVSGRCGILPIKKFNVYRNGFVDCMTRKGITDTVDWNGANAFCVHKGNVYVFDAIEKKRWFCFQREKWKKLSKMPYEKAIDTHGIVTISYNDKLLFTAGHRRWESTDKVDAYNVSEDKWVKFPNLNQTRHAPSFVVYKDHVYITGGSVGMLDLESVERFDLESNKWEIMPSMNIARTYHASSVYNDKIYVGGGWGKTMSLCSVETFLEGDSSWTTIVSLNISRRGLGMFVRREQLYAFGGTRSKKSSLYETFNEESNSWKCSNMRDNETFECKILIL